MPTPPTNANFDPKPIRVRSWLAHSPGDKLPPADVNRAVKRIRDGENPERVAQSLRESLGSVWRFLELPQEIKISTERYLDRRAATIVSAIKLKEPRRPVRDPDDTLDPVVEVAEYVDRWHERYRRTINHLSAQIPPMQHNCRASICIPAAAHDEAHYIGRALRAFTNQTINPEQFEIVVLANFPRTAREEHSSRIFETLDQIRRFQNEHPEMFIHVASAELRGSTVSRIGFIRSLVTDLALLRHAVRQKDDDHILIQCDADTRAVDDQYVAQYLQLFDDSPFIDAAHGRLLWSPETAARNPEAFAALSLHSFLLGAASRKNDIVKCGGPNFAMRASSYAAVNGYREPDDLYEGSNLGRSFLHLRANATVHAGVVSAGGRSRLFTSDRRSITALESGVAVSEQWTVDGLRFQSIDHVRRTDPSNAAVPLCNRRSLERVLYREILAANRLGIISVVGVARTQNFLRGYLGLDCELSPQLELTIHDDREFKARFERFGRDRYPEWQIQFGFDK